ncbi:MAG: inositol monophosphatase family protein [Rhodospirillales bacterium]|jgi:fructose-1,6-bisphosphatase/inositol monophosphatase family enzyme
MRPDIGTVIAILEEVAATEIMPRFRNLSSSEIGTKSGPRDLVTTADLESEKRLTQAFSELVPGCVVVGEEGADENPDILKALDREAPVWLVDPVDGTNNFAEGKECFAVMAAYLVKGETLAAWIHDPINNDTVWAARGEGAWLNQMQLNPTTPSDIKDMTAAFGPKLRKRLTENANGDAIPGNFLWHRCVGRDYIGMAKGDIQFARYGGKVKPWDHAPGNLIHREIGGFSAMFDDKETYQPGWGILQNQYLVYAPNTAHWDTLHGLLSRS